MTKPLAITLSQDKVQYILNVLAERPFKEVADLIPDIVKQSTDQLAPTAYPPLAAVEP